MGKYNKLQHKINKLFSILLSFIFLLVLFILILNGVGQTKFSRLIPNKINSEPQYATPILHTDTITNSEDPITTISRLSDSLTSSNAFLIRLEDHKVLLEKDSETTIYPASLTKIMTAIVAIENLPYLEEPILLSCDMFQKLYEEDASMAGFLPGEEVPAIDLLYGVLLPSGAECSEGLAEYIAGSQAKFVALMNETAKKLGMLNTNFSNVTGLHEEDHYTTVKDIAILLEYALQNDTFLEIFTSRKHATESTNLHPYGITFTSTMFKNMESPDILGGSILGGKTGYTSEAGLCLASLAIKNNKEYILVTAGANGDHTTRQYHISDALYTYNHIEE